MSENKKLLIAIIAMILSGSFFLYGATKTGSIVVAYAGGLFSMLSYFAVIFISGLAEFKTKEEEIK